MGMHLAGKSALEIALGLSQRRESVWTAIRRATARIEQQLGARVGPPLEM
jgi:hypothetical protein